MKIKLLAGAALILGTSACMKIEDYPQKIENGPVGFSANTGFDAKRLTPTRMMTVRSLKVTGADKKGRKEVRGAKCTLRSPELKADFTTPAQFNAPKITGKPGTITLTCTLDGVKQVRSFEPGLPHKRTLVTGSGSNGAALAGLLITVVATAASAENARKRDEWEYFPADSPELTMTFE